ncbi:YALI0B06446p [Yarrowia lipolytica CLIB122]|uniref:RNA-directed DNA polymerase n=1 Tax=Yarrowia lipolytica (strain CLIB 122 / E 150) TaxID=284591 RepID=Q6CFJ4_YARLI|nr:YALI0B06446p [Yarrowia lipolytica CLIB122]CAG82799.1 YALI0B06446p [Yarrowia lipolytica CLIB122]|eukprot:XP_500568.1 YALI0B06446p [Yarrowia lipolytica CLIB122]
MSKVTKDEFQALTAKMDALTLSHQEITTTLATAVNTKEFRSALDELKQSNESFKTHQAGEFEKLHQLVSAQHETIANLSKRVDSPPSTSSLEGISRIGKADSEFEPDTPQKGNSVLHGMDFAASDTGSVDYRKESDALKSIIRNEVYPSLSSEEFRKQLYAYKSFDSRVATFILLQDDIRWSTRARAFHLWCGVNDKQPLFDQQYLQLRSTFEAETADESTKPGAHARLNTACERLLRDLFRKRGFDHEPAVSFAEQEEELRFRFKDYHTAFSIETLRAYLSALSTALTSSPLPVLSRCLQLQKLAPTHLGTALGREIPRDNTRWLSLGMDSDPERDHQVATELIQPLAKMITQHVQRLDDLNDEALLRWRQHTVSFEDVWMWVEPSAPPEPSTPEPDKVVVHVAGRGRSTRKPADGPVSTETVQKPTIRASDASTSWAADKAPCVFCGSTAHALVNCDDSEGSPLVKAKYLGSFKSFTRLGYQGFEKYLSPVDADFPLKQSALYTSWKQKEWSNPLMEPRLRTFNAQWRPALAGRVNAVEFVHVEDPGGPLDNSYDSDSSASGYDFQDLLQPGTFSVCLGGVPRDLLSDTFSSYDEPRTIIDSTDSQLELTKEAIHQHILQMAKQPTPLPVTYAIDAPVSGSYSGNMKRLVAHPAFMQLVARLTAPPGTFKASTLEAGFVGAVMAPSSPVAGRVYFVDAVQRLLNKYNVVLPTKLYECFATVRNDLMEPAYATEGDPRRQSLKTNINALKTVVDSKHPDRPVAPLPRRSPRRDVREDMPPPALPQATKRGAASSTVSSAAPPTAKRTKAVANPSSVGPTDSASSTGAVVDVPSSRVAVHPPRLGDNHYVSPGTRVTNHIHDASAVAENAPLKDYKDALDRLPSDLEDSKALFTRDHPRYDNALLKAGRLPLFKLEAIHALPESEKADLFERILKASDVDGLVLFELLQVCPDLTKYIWKNFRHQRHRLAGPDIQAIALELGDDLMECAMDLALNVISSTPYELNSGTFGRLQEVFTTIDRQLYDDKVGRPLSPHFTDNIALFDQQTSALFDSGSSNNVIDTDFFALVLAKAGVTPDRVIVFSDGQSHATVANGAKVKVDFWALLPVTFLGVVTLETFCVMKCSMKCILGTGYISKLRISFDHDRYRVASVENPGNPGVRCYPSDRPSAGLVAHLGLLDRLVRPGRRPVPAFPAAKLSRQNVMAHVRPTPSLCGDVDEATNLLDASSLGGPQPGSYSHRSETAAGCFAISFADDCESAGPPSSAATAILKALASSSGPDPLGIPPRDDPDESYSSSPGHHGDVSGEPNSSSPGHTSAPVDGTLGPLLPTDASSVDDSNELCSSSSGSEAPSEAPSGVSAALSDVGTVFQESYTSYRFHDNLADNALHARPPDAHALSGFISSADLDSVFQYPPPASPCSCCQQPVRECRVLGNTVFIMADIGDSATIVQVQPDTDLSMRQQLYLAEVLSDAQEITPEDSLHSLSVSVNAMYKPLHKRSLPLNKLRPDCSFPVGDGSKPSPRHRNFSGDESCQFDAKLAPVLFPAELALCRHRMSDTEGVWAFNEDQEGVLSHHIEEPTKIYVEEGGVINSKHFPLRGAMVGAAKDIIMKGLANGQMEPSSSPHRNAWFLVSKKSSGYRFILDCQGLNKITLRDAFHPPNADLLAESFCGRAVTSLLDIKNGYGQKEIAPESRDLTAFNTDFGSYRLTRLPQGWCNSPAVFHRAMLRVLGPLFPDQAVVFLDDIGVLGPKTDYGGAMHDDFPGCRRYIVEHMDNLMAVLQNLYEAGLTVSFDKAELFVSEAEFLGFLTTSEGRFPSPGSSEKIESFEFPTTVRGVRSFLGAVVYFRMWIPHFSSIAAPLYDCISAAQKAGKLKITKTEATESAFMALKKAMVSPAVLHRYDPTLPIVITTDASSLGWGAVMSHIVSVGPPAARRPVRFESGLWNPTERTYASTKTECLAVKRALEKCRHYVTGVHFVIETDNQALVFLLQQSRVELPNAMFTRWFAYIKQFDYEVRFVKGRDNPVADWLSREKFSDFRPVDFRPPVADTARQADELAPLVPPTWSPVASITVLSIGPEPVFIHKGISLDLIFTTIASGDLDRDGVDIPPRLRQICSEFFIFDDILLLISSPGLHRRVLFTEKEVSEVLRATHEQYGHRGAAAILHALRRLYYWPGMADHVKSHRASCGTCAKATNHGLLKASLHFVVPRLIWETVQLDILYLPAVHGPTKEYPDLADPAKALAAQTTLTDFLPTAPQFTDVSSAPRGRLNVTIAPYQYVLVARDEFSGWPEAVPLRSINSLSTAAFFYDFIIARFGVPRRVYTDGGSEFKGDFKHLCEDFHIKQVFTTPAHGQSTGIVERGHQNLLHCLRKYGRQWILYLHTALWADRCTRRSSTGKSPFELMYGVSGVLPVESRFLTWNYLSGKTDLAHNDPAHAAFLRTLQLAASTFEVGSARDHLTLQRQRQKAFYDKHHNTADTDPLAVNDFVFVHDLRPHNKLTPRWTGPSIVTACHPETSTYTVNDVDGENPRRIHRNRLKVFHPASIVEFQDRMKEHQSRESALPAIPGRFSACSPHVLPPASVATRSVRSAATTASTRVTSRSKLARVDSGLAQGSFLAQGLYS